MSEIPRTMANRSFLPRVSSRFSSSKLTSKWSSMAVFPRPVTMMMFWMPECSASSTPYWMMGLSTIGSISFGCALVAGRKRVPSPAAGKTAFLTLAGISFSFVPIRSNWQPGNCVCRWAVLFMDTWVDTQMAYIIAEPCIGTKDTACVDACPVDCIHPKKDEANFAEAEMLYIDPVECIDCGACVPVCPVSAIFALDDLPEKWAEFTAKNAAYYGR